MADDKEKKTLKEKIKEKINKAKVIGMLAVGITAATCFKSLDSNVDKNFKTIDKDVPNKTINMQNSQSKPQRHENDPIPLPELDKEKLKEMLEAEQQKKGPEKPDTIEIDGHIVEEVKIDKDLGKPVFVDIAGHQVEELPFHEVDDNKEPLYNAEEFNELKKDLKEMEIEAAMDFVQSYGDYKEGQKSGRSKESLERDREDMFDSGSQMKLVGSINSMLPMLEKSLQFGDLMINTIDLAGKQDETTYTAFADKVKQDGLKMAKDAQKQVAEAKKFTKEAKKESEKTIRVAEAWEKNPDSKIIDNYLDNMYKDAKKILEPMRKERENEVRQENRVAAAELKQENASDIKMARESGDRKFARELRKEGRASEAEMRKDHQKTSKVSVQDMVNDYNGR